MSCSLWPRSTAYYRPALLGEEDGALMRLIDEIHLEWPFYGSRRIRDELQHEATALIANGSSV